MKRFLVLGTMLALALTGVANAQSEEAVLGPWVLKISAAGMEFEMNVNVKKEGDALTMSMESPRGNQDAENVRFEDGQLKWTAKMGPQALDLAVKVDGDTFAGQVDSPFGPIILTGVRMSAEAAAAQSAKYDALKGEWTVYSTYKGEQFESSMFFTVEGGELEAQVTMGGVESSLDRVNLNGKELMWFVPVPYVANQPARVTVTLNDEGKGFEGKAMLGDEEITLRGELVDTSKLIVPAYDDPTGIIGTWEVTTEFGGQTAVSTVEFKEVDSRLHALIKYEGGEYEATEVEYSIVNKAMGVIKVHAEIADLAPGKLTFELIVDGESFEGEEINSNGAILLTGKKTA